MLCRQVSRVGQEGDRARHVSTRAGDGGLYAPDFGKARLEREASVAVGGMPQLSVRKCRIAERQVQLRPPGGSERDELLVAGLDRESHRLISRAERHTRVALITQTDRDVVVGLGDAAD